MRVKSEMSYPSKANILVTMAMAGIAAILTSATVQARIDVKALSSTLEAADTTGAEASIEAALAADKSDFEALYWRGKIAYARGDWQAAKLSFGSSFEIKKNFYQSL